MKKEIKTRIWGFFETLAFCGIYVAVAYIAKFVLHLIYAVYYAVMGAVNNELFDGGEFLAEVTNAVSGANVELTILADILIVILCAIVIYARGGKFKKYMGLGKSGLLQIVGAICAGAAIWYLSINVLSDVLAGTETLQEYGKHMGRLNRSSIWMTMALTVVVAPISEEMMFRGALFSSVQRFLNKPFAVIITSLLFGAVHGNFVQFVYAFVLGILLSFIRAETGRLWPCIVMHMSFNAMNYFIAGYICPFWVAIVIFCIGYGLALYKKV